MNSNIQLPGFEEVIILKSEVRGGTYILHVECPVTPHTCPACQEKTIRIHDYRWTKLKHLKVMERMTTIFYRKRRYRCHCGKRFAEKNTFVDRYQRFTKEWNGQSQIRAIKAKSFKEVAMQYGTSISTIIRRFDQIVPKEMKGPKALPKAIAIDEFKGNAGGNKFQLIVADAETREPLDVLPDRRKETIVAYLREHGANVEIVVMDMSHAFRAAVQKALNKPIIIADRFHFVRYAYNAMDRVRMRVQKEWNDYDRKQVKQRRFVFFKKSDQLTEKDQWYLTRYFTLSDEMRVAYEVKEQFCRWFEQAKENGEENMRETKAGLYAFYEAVREAAIPEFGQMVKMLQNWETEILNTFRFGYNNGFVEGLNNLTKVIKRNAFGFRRFDRMRAKVLLTHQYKQVGNFLG